ncbi:MAG TPA: ATP-binding protein [Kiritimatiellia bacterium]|nr:ATP-binding protein [Kiritimatiellia bacterium]HRZ12268.1 ATP-binding protein [Kiritimatiellia bacterium]HSA17974.1 ATP-binding protein [Kiritimatiellia bacterium]
MSPADPSVARRLLVVEDDETVRRFLVELFRKSGYRADAASNGAEALELVEENPCDVMILDQKMPGLSGLDVLERLRAIGPPFPVIVLSGHGSEELAVQALHMGATDYVTKAPDPRFGEILLDKTRRAIERFAQEEEQRAHVETLRQRMSELGCLYALEKLFDSVEGSPRVALSAAADILLPGAGGRCCAVIRIGKEEYASANRFESGHVESFDIRERGKTIGTLDIRFRDGAGAPPLSDMERDLMMAVSDRIGHFMDFWHTEQRLRESNAALEEYAYVASHDLQAPLQKIESFAQLLQEDCASRLDESGRYYVSVVHRSAQQMRRLIKDVLALARLDSDGLAIKPLKLGDILAAVKDQLSQRLVERNAVLATDALPTVPGDETRLTQLFQNLVGNALKFNDKPEPRVEVGAVEEPGHWRIYVRDNGIGMTREDAGRLFVPFKRLHTGEKYEGTGIGLALCRKIVRQHGGTIDVDAEPGKGCTFWIRLPKEPATAAPNDVNTSAQPP